MTAIDLLARPVYGLVQVDRLLGLPQGTARRWIDGYRRAGKSYPPVIREETTGDELVTWGEFIETRLLAGYRERGVPMLRMRPAIERLRDYFGTGYPLAHARPWIAVEGRELVLAVQDEVGLDKPLRLVVRTGQIKLELAQPAEEFFHAVEFDNDVAARLHPMPGASEVVMDPLRNFGEPVVRSVATEVIAEQVRAGDSAEMIAELYELPPASVWAAVRYELWKANAAETA